MTAAGVFTSTDAGVTWTQETAPGTSDWFSIATSADGSKLATAAYGGNVWTYQGPAPSWKAQAAAPAESWSSIASSSDGSKLVASVSGGGIYTSANAGVTWTQTSAVIENWYSVASSANGTKLSAAVYGGGIYTSTDSGATWTEQTSAGNRYWRSIASSADGTKLVAGRIMGHIFTSSDSGSNWTEQLGSPYKDWYSVASSSDGTKLAAVDNGTYVYTSSDSGVTWVERTNSGGDYWSSIASSADGTKLAATRENSSSIFTSTDSGDTWTEQPVGYKADWPSITSSSDGTKLAAVAYGGSIYTSSDSGSTWVEQTTPGSSGWRSIASNSDATKLAAVSNSGLLWTYLGQAPAPTIASVAPTSGPTAGGTSFTITGTGFVTGATVTVGGSACTGVSVVSATSITCSTPAGVAGAKDVVVTNVDTQTVTSAGAFTYTAPVFSASTPAIPNTYVGSFSAGQTETITNTGNSDLVFGDNAVTIAGTNSGDFTLLSDHCSNYAVAPADNCTVSYKFTPSAVGTRTANLVFASNSGTSPDSVVLSATGVGRPVFSASTPSIPNTYVGSFSPVQTETVANTGNGNLVFGAGAVTKTGTNPADYTIVADNCSNQTVAPAGACTVTYKFKSAVAGTRTANLVFASNAASSADSVALSAVAMGVVTIRKIGESSGSTRGGTSVEITGTGFNAAATVTIGGVNATVTKRKGSTSITVKTPAHAAGKVLVVVTNPDTGNASYNGFTYKR